MFCPAQEQRYPSLSMFRHTLTHTGTRHISLQSETHVPTFAEYADCERTHTGVHILFSVSNIILLVALFLADDANAVGLYYYLLPC